jgi:hypothetical protein
MKQTLLLFLLLISTHTFAQTIQSFAILPSNPTETDSITILADCSFSAGPCEQHSGGISINGNTIDSWSLHCLGMLTVICNHTDTFYIGTLSAGNYIFHFQLDKGYGEVACTPGIVAGPDSSYSFTVLPATQSADDYQSEQHTFSVNPNPVSDYAMIYIPPSQKNYPLKLTLMNIYGQKIIERTFFPSDEISLDMKNYTAGIYFLKIASSHSNSLIKLIKQ